MIVEALAVYAIWRLAGDGGFLGVAGGEGAGPGDDRFFD